MSKPLFPALKILLLSLSLPLLFTSNAWAKTCTETEVNTYLRDGSNALFACDAGAIPVLIEALKNNNAKIRNHGVQALVFQVGIKDEIVVPALVRALKDEDTEVRQAASGALAIVAIEGDIAIPALIEALSDKDAEVRHTAAYALRNFGNQAEIVLPALIKALEDSDATVRSGAALALAEIGADTKTAIPALIKALKDDNSGVRSYAAYALSRNDTDYGVSIPGLLETLKDPYAHVRSNAAVALYEIGVEDTDAIPPLIHLLEDKNISVRSSAVYALGLFSTDPNAVLPALIKALKDKDFEVRKEAARSLKEIAANQYSHTSTMQQTDQALAVVSTIKEALADPSLQKDDVYLEDYRLSVETSLESLQNKRQSFLLQSTTEWISTGKEVWLAHAVFWLVLILVYPKSSQIQAIFFWNPWVRKIMGLGYVGFALTWVPFLRRSLFAPFRESLLADAGLENFKPAAYFENSDIKNPNSGDISPIRETIPGFKGQVVLEGASGLGKTMFLRHLCQQSQRVVVYLPATKCADGVIEAIQRKLHGEEIKDPKFLQNLIYSGAIAICIDGLNEVSADTRAKIVEFTENYFKGDIILATQPMEWTPPSTAKQFVMQPLGQSHIQAFLLSRRPLIPDYALVREEAYKESCDRYLEQVLNARQAPEELEATQRILSNPMDLTVIASMLAAGKQPDLFRLQEQQYTVMIEGYQEKHLGQEFPLESFSEAVYQMRLKDEATLPEAQFLEELLGMERHKMVVSRQSKDSEGKPAKEWHFRHDKITEFFIIQTFLKHLERQEEHLGDPRFRGVYFMLANFLKLEDAIALRETLIQYAADTKDHTVSDTFVQLLRSRQVQSSQTAA